MSFARSSFTPSGPCPGLPAVVHGSTLNRLAFSAAQCRAVGRVGGSAHGRDGAEPAAAGGQRGLWQRRRAAAAAGGAPPGAAGDCLRAGRHADAGVPCGCCLRSLSSCLALAFQLLSTRSGLSLLQRCSSTVLSTPNFFCRPAYLILLLKSHSFRFRYRSKETAGRRARRSAAAAARARRLHWRRCCSSISRRWRLPAAALLAAGTRCPEARSTAVAMATRRRPAVAASASSPAAAAAGTAPTAAAGTATVVAAAAGTMAAAR